jgi:hypothetical protein
MALQAVVSHRLSLFCVIGLPSGRWLGRLRLGKNHSGGHASYRREPCKVPFHWLLPLQFRI